jgi:hypothetical protein
MSLHISPNSPQVYPQIPHISPALNIFGVLIETHVEPRAVLLHYIYSSRTLTLSSAFCTHSTLLLQTFFIFCNSPLKLRQHSFHHGSSTCPKDVVERSCRIPDLPCQLLRQQWGWSWRRPRYHQQSTLHVDTIWLSPIFKSPQKDMGYDAADYRSIHAPYGNVEDV